MHCQRPRPPSLEGAGDGLLGHRSATGGPLSNCCPLCHLERTEKLPMGSIKNVVSEPIEGHEDYHMMVSSAGARRRGTGS